MPEVAAPREHPFAEEQQKALCDFIRCYSMPTRFNSERTKSLARAFAEELGVLRHAIGAAIGEILFFEDGEDNSGNTNNAELAAQRGLKKDIFHLYAATPSTSTNPGNRLDRLFNALATLS